MISTGHWSLGTGHWTLDTGHRMQASLHHTLHSVYRSKDICRQILAQKYCWFGNELKCWLNSVWNYPYALSLWLLLCQLHCSIDQCLLDYLCFLVLLYKSVIDSRIWNGLSFRMVSYPFSWSWFHCWVNVVWLGWLLVFCYEWCCCLIMAKILMYYDIRFELMHYERYIHRQCLSISESDGLISQRTSTT